MANHVYKADITEDGKLGKIHSKAYFDNDLKRYAGQSIKITFTKWHKSKSLPQLRFYYGSLIHQVRDALVDAGWNRLELSEEVIHIFLKNQFFYTEIISVDGEVMRAVKSLKDATTVDVMTYFEDIGQWMAEKLQATLILPGEQAEIW